MKLPALNSRWIVVGTNHKLQVVNIWSAGVKDSYHRTLYELRYDGRSRSQFMQAARLHELINERKIELINN